MPLIALSDRIGRKAVLCSTLVIFTLAISTINIASSTLVIVAACLVCGLAESTNACVACVGTFS